MQCHPILYNAYFTSTPAADHHHQEVDEVDHQEPDGIQKSDLLTPEDVEGPEAGQEVKADVPEEGSLHQFERSGDGDTAKHQQSMLVQTLH